MFLTRVELTNVRCIRSMTLPLEMSSGVTRKWTLLLGDNGVGKSTLMRSIGLVLAGSSALAELIGDPDSWVHVGEEQCTISADLETADGEKRQISLKISRGDTIKEVYETNKETLELARSRNRARVAELPADRVRRLTAPEQHEAVDADRRLALPAIRAPTTWRPSFPPTRC